MVYKRGKKLSKGVFLPQNNAIFGLIFQIMPYNRRVGKEMKRMKTPSKRK